MSDCTNYPTYSYNYTTDPYNPTQVRLYGIVATPGFAYPGVPARFSSGDTVTSVATPDKSSNRLDPFVSDEALKGIFVKAESEFEKNKFHPDFSAVLPILPFPILGLPMKYVSSLNLNMLTLFDSTVNATASITTSVDVTLSNRLSIGIIFAYAFEGKTYDLPRPKIMLITQFPVNILDNDTDYFGKPGYMVWVVDKLDTCVEIEINQGFVEQIVLEANLPGKRSPTSYRANAALSHRSGRLTE